MDEHYGLWMQDGYRSNSEAHTMYDNSRAVIKRIKESK